MEKNRLGSKCFLLTFNVVLAVCLLSGCGPETPDGMPKLIPVTLQLTQSGEPLAGASVHLLPTEPASNWVSGGGTDEQGKCVMRTHGTYAGVPVGKYKVRILKTITEGDSGARDITKPGLAEASDLKTLSLVDLKFTLAASTPLELEVTDSDAIIQTFELGAAVRVEMAAPPF